MRKQTKLVAVLSATALLAIGAAMTSFAATGWVDEDGSWVYYDSDGEQVTDEWKKSGSNWYYLDEDGYMAIDQWVDNDYYVNESGVMVTNAWVKTMADDEEAEDPDSDGENWFFFDSKGKKITDKWKSVNGYYYHFDSEGQMSDGWFQDGDSVYYLGDEDDGARKAGWLWLEADNDDDGIDAEMNTDQYDEEAWYWFDSNGKRYEKAGTKKINGKYYAFNEYGQMLSGWVILGSTDTASSANAADYGKLADKKIADLRYFNEDGSRAAGWLKADGSETLGKQDNNKWYYFSSGKAKYGEDVAALTDHSTGADFTRTRSKIKIDGKWFSFDEFGQMTTGLQAIANGSDSNAVYYFDSNGYMKTGKVTGVEEDDDETYTYYFSTNNSDKGQGFSGVKDGYLYFQGKRQEAADDYTVVKVNDNYYVVNENGKIQKNTSKEYSVENAKATVKVEKKGDNYVVVNPDTYTFTNDAEPSAPNWEK